MAQLELDESRETAFRAALAKRDATRDARKDAELLTARARIEALEGVRGEVTAL